MRAYSLLRIGLKPRIYGRIDAEPIQIEIVRATIFFWIICYPRAHKLLQVGPEIRCDTFSM